MRIPAIKGIIRRRILVNYVAEPDVIQNILPNGFRPKLFKGKAVAGICLIRLEQIRPKILPAFFGVASENAAHRIAVEWNKNGETKQGVYVPRRDTDSFINTAAGGRLFPGEHHHAEFKISEGQGKISFSMLSEDATVSVNFSGELDGRLPENSLFCSNRETSDFFKSGSLGYSSRKNSNDLDGITLEIENWKVIPLSLRFVHSSYFEDEAYFPKNSVRFDHALYMENVDHLWHSAPTFRQQLSKAPVAG